ncbi:MAG: hypothetical protein ACOVP1_01230 [Bacteroidia bacterium]
MKTVNYQVAPISTQSKAQVEPSTMNKPYVLWTKTNRPDLLNLEVIDGFLKDNMILHFAKQSIDSGKLIVEFERTRAVKLNNYFNGDILQDLRGIQQLVIRIFETKSLISETVTSIGELN